MFSQRYNELEPFVTPTGNEIMKNITASAAFGDISLLAITRALLFERLNGAEFYTCYTDYWENDPSRSTTRLLDMYFDKKAGNKIVFLNALTEEVYQQMMDRLNPKALAKDKTYQLTFLEDFSDQVGKKAKISYAAFNNPDKNLALIVSSGLDLRTLRLLTAFMRTYIPKVFQDKPINDDEMALLTTLTKRNAKDFEAALIKIGKNMNLRDQFLKVMVGKFERREMERMISQCEKRVRDYALRVENFMTEYVNAVKNHTKEMMTLEGMRARQSDKEENSELLDYLTSHPHIDVLKIDGSNIHIHIKTFCDIYDQSMWDKYAAREDLFKNNMTNIECFKDPQNVKILLNAIFNEDPVLRLKFCGYYQLNLDGSVYTSSGHSYGPDYVDYLPNPHLQYHACLGDNRPQISRMLTEGNLIGAFECATASCKSISMGEVTQTLRPMIREIIQSPHKIIHTEDGDMTPEEALNWLKAKEKK